MAEFKASSSLMVKITIILDEDEARALDALAGYGDDAFIGHFYEKLGRYYLEPYEKGLRSFLVSVRQNMPSRLREIDKARQSLLA